MLFNFKKQSWIYIIIIMVVVSIGVAIISMRDSENNPDGNGEDDSKGKRWEDLYKFKQYLFNNYTIREKKDSNTAVIDKIADPEDALWIVIGVEKEFTSEEASAVRKFVSEGGDFIIASDSTLANKISLQFGVEYSTHRIIEMKEYDRNEFFIPMSADLDKMNYRILTNSPLGLLSDENVTTINFTVVAGSSDYAGFGEYSFLDQNDNGKSDAEDMLGPIPAIIEISYGKKGGKIIFISDTALFTDDLWERGTQKADYENNLFARGLIEYTVSKQGLVVYDFSKHVNYSSGHLHYPS